MCSNNGIHLLVDFPNVFSDIAVANIRSKSVKRSFLILWFVIGGLWHLSSLQATHVVGGGMRYRCLGGNNYEITLRVYRDCFYGDLDAFFDTTASVGIYNSNQQLVTELLIPYNPSLNDTLSLPFSDTCLFIASDICVHTTYYRDTVNLPYHAGGYTIAYQRCCRNSSLYNILNPLETGATFFMHLSGPSMASCNSMPVFEESTQYYLCVNEPFILDHSAIDEEGDSLVYRLATPYSGGSLQMGMPQPPAPPPYNQVSWVDPPYNADNMLGFGTAPLTIDPMTGIVTGNPGLIGQYVVGIAVDEYRNGVLLSTTRRDFQYHVGLCAELVAKIQAPAVQCENLTVAFTNKSQLASSYLWTFNDPNNPSGKSTLKNPTFTFSDTGTYTVRLIAQPGSACADTAWHELFLQSNSLEADFEVELVKCVDSVRIIGLDQSTDPVSPVNSWLWELSYGTTKLTSTNQDAYFIIPDTGILITLSLYVTSENGCSDSHFYTFELNPIPEALLFDTLVICAGESIGLNPNFATGYQYSWSPANFLSDSTAANPIATPPSTTLFTAQVSDATGFCSIEKGVLVEVRNPQLDFTFRYQCDGMTVEFENASSAIDAYVWDFGVDSTSLDSSTSVNPVFTFPEAGAYTVQLRSLPGYPCQLPDTIEKTIIIGGPVVEAGLEAVYSSCAPDEINMTLEDNSTIFQGVIQSWQWYIADSLWSVDATPSDITIESSDTLSLTLVVISDEGCIDSVSRNLAVHVIPNGGFQDTVVACPFDSVALYPGAVPGYSYSWTPLAGLSSNNQPNPLALPDTQTTYSVLITAISTDTCTLSRTVTVLTPVAMNPDAGKDSVSCAVEYLLQGNTSAPAAFQWTDLDGNTLGTGSTLLTQAQGQTTFILRTTDNLGCSEQDSVVITFNAVDLNYTPIQLFCQGTTDTLIVNNIDPNDTLLYSWSPASLIISGETSGKPAIVTSSPFQQIFSFTASNQHGCFAEGHIEAAVLQTDTTVHQLKGEQCLGLTAFFEHTGPNADYYEWHIDEFTSPAVGVGSTLSYTFPDTGLYNIILYLPVAGCEDTLSFPFEVKNGPFIEAGFGIEITNCQPGSAEIQLSDSSFHQQAPIDFWEWHINDSLLFSDPDISLALNEDQVLGVTLVVSTAAGCRDSIYRNVPIKIVAEYTLADTLVICPQSQVPLNPVADSSYAYTWSPAVFVDDALSPSPIAFPSTSTTFSLQITAVTPYTTCLVEDSVTVIVLPAPGLHAPADTQSCLPELLLAANTLQPSSISWLSLNDSSLIAGQELVVATNGELTYQVQAIGDNGCIEKDTLTISGNPVSVSTDASSFLNCQGSLLQVPIISNYAGDQLLISSNPFQLFSFGITDTILTANTTASGTFEETVLFTNQYGCTQSIDFQVNIIDEDINLSFDPIPSCDGLTITFENTTTNGLGDFFSWNFGDPGSTSDSSSANQPIYTYPDTGTYLVSLSLNEPLICADTFLAPVIITDEVLKAAFEVEYQTCYTDSISLFLVNQSRNEQTAETNLYWYFDGSLISQAEEIALTIEGDTVIEVVLVAETPLGCIDSFSQMVEIAPLEAVSISDTLIRCPGESIYLNPGADSSLTYLWTPPFGLDNPQSPNPLATPLATITYGVVISKISSDTCSVEGEVLVVVPPPINLQVPEDFNTCETQVLLSATASAPVQWKWYDLGGNDLGTTASISYSPSGLEFITVTATDLSGCSETDSLQIGGYSIDILAPDDTFFCVGDPASLSIINLDATDQLNIFWQPGVFIQGPVTNASIDIENEVFFDTTFTYFVSNQFGCSLTGNLEVTMLDTVAPESVLTYGQCEGLTVNFLFDSPNAPYYTWEFGDTLNPGATAIGSNVSYTYPDTGTYLITLQAIQPGVACLPSYTFGVQVTDGPFFNMIADWNYLECGDSALIQFSDESSHIQDELISWEWVFSNGVTDSTAQPMLAINNDQLLQYTLKVSSSVGCMDSLQGEIDIQLINVNLPEPMLICKGDSISLNPDTPNPDYSYQWAPSDGLSDPNAPNPIAFPNTSTTYTVTITDDSSGDTCMVVRTVTVNLYPIIELATSGDIVLCDDVPVTLEANTNLPTNLQWSDTPDFSTTLSTAGSLTVNPGRPAIFYIKATDGNACYVVDTLEVGNYIPSIDLANTLTICAGEETQLSADNNYPQDSLTYFWTPEFYFTSGFETATPTLTLDDSITLFVEVSNQYGCVLIDSIKIEVINLEDELFVFASPDTISYGGSTQLFATFNPAYTYNWMPVEGLSNPSFHQPIASPLETVLYTLQVESQNGCIRTDSLLITVVERACAEPYIFVPLAFSPNNDGENDILYVRGNQIDKMRFSVFNRWGEEVFRSTNPSNGWNGRYNGKDLPPDVFGYYLEVTCLNGETYFKKGNITLLR